MRCSTRHASAGGREVSSTTISHRASLTGLRVFAARDRGLELCHLREKFKDQSVADAEWIRALAAEGSWAIVSADPRITKGKAEQAAWRESGLTTFFFGSGWTEQSYWEQVADLVRWWPDIVRAAREAPTGTGHLMALHAKKFKILYDPK